MHGSGGQTCKQSRHMWPVPHSPVATVASNGSHVPNFISKDGRKIRVGDCALFKPLQDSPPFIGIIRRLSYKEDNISLGVNWLYRPADIKLSKGNLQEATPNEVFYSFHKDEIPAASLLHPCKVAFLRKGVELPTGVSSFVCRRVYDIENRCLWWLTDKDYIDERQEEVDKLLDKTRVEMHGGVQSGGRSPKQLNGPLSAQLKSGTDSVQNSTSSSSQAKGKKRERGDQGNDSIKRERLSKTEDGESGQFGSENMLKSEISKIAEKGGLVNFEGVERLVQLMQPDSADKKIDLGGRIMLVDVIAVTDRFDCLGQFVQLGGLRVLDEWLQEVHKGKIGDSSSAKESDKSVEEFLLALLRALDKLPVNLPALKTCNVGKSVNHLRTHKNSEIQKKSRSLVDTWKKRVEAEMNMNDAKTGSGRAVSWHNKPASSEVLHVGSKKTGSSTEVGSKNLVQHAVSKTMHVRHSTGEVVPKTCASSGVTKPLASSVGIVSKEQNSRMLVVAGNSDTPLAPIKEERSSTSSAGIVSKEQNSRMLVVAGNSDTPLSLIKEERSSTSSAGIVSKEPNSRMLVVAGNSDTSLAPIKEERSSTSSAGIVSKEQNSRMLVVTGISDIPLGSIKEERSSSSSQSLNNSQSSDHVKTLGSCREDAKSSTAGSLSVSTASRHRKSGNGPCGSAISGVPKEPMLGRFTNPGKSLHSEKSSATGVSYGKPNEVPLVDHGNNRIIVRFPNTGWSPARGVSAGSFDDQGGMYGRTASPTAEKHDNPENKHKSEAFRPSVSSDVNSDSFQGRDGLARFEEVDVPSVCGELHKASEDVERPMEVSKAEGEFPKVVSRLGKSYEASLCSINALIESCAKFSEASPSASPGDDVGMNLLASVAAREISKYNSASSSGSPCMDSPVPEVSCSGDDGKFKQEGEEVAQVQSQSQHVGGISSAVTLEQCKTGDFFQSKDESRHPVSHSSTNSYGDTKGISVSVEERAKEQRTQLNCSSGSHQNIDATPLVSDVKPGKLCDASVALCSGKESFSEVEGVNQVDQPRKAGSSWSQSNHISNSELKTETSFLEVDKKEDYADERAKEDSMPVLPAAAVGSEKVDAEDEKPKCSTLDVGVKSHNSKEESSNDVLEEQKSSNDVLREQKSSNDVLKEQKSSFTSKGDLDLVERKNEDDVLLSTSGNGPGEEFTGENVDDSNAEGHTKGIDEHIGDVCPISKHDNELHMERVPKESLVSSMATSHVGSPSIPSAEKEQLEDSSQKQRSGAMVEEQVSSTVSASGPDASTKLDFDLNEGFPIDDGSNVELPKFKDPGNSSAVHLPCPLPFQFSSISSSFPISITVASPAKGPFVFPENPLQSKGELGWRGSAATSAFRPAEPRKNLEMLPSTSEPIVDTPTSKPSRTPLDFDLNVPDERAYDDIGSESATHGFSSESRPNDGRAGGLDLDLNRVDEGPDAGPFSCFSNSRMEIPSLPGMSSLSTGLSNGRLNATRDFDLNDGPGLDDSANETAQRTQPFKSGLPLAAPVSGVRVSTAEFGNFSSWYPGNSYSAITVPSIFPGQTDQSYVSPVGSQRILCPPGSTTFGPEMYRGPVLTSSPAVAFSPTASFQYPGFPFETSFPLSSNSFSGGSTAYMDSSSGGAICFPTIPTQLLGPAGVVSPPYPRPYVMSLPGGASNVGPDGRKWTSQGLDLNTGPGNAITEWRDERLPSGLRQLSVPSSQALVEEHLKMFQGGGILKRKEPDGGLDSMDIINYKQHSWQ